MNAFATVFLSMLGGMAGKLLNEKFFKWAILWAAKKIVEATENKHDDEWFSKIEELLKEK